ncbi:hypothetical protein Cni_G28064 [Canna indica]|uniref:Uncharacterized protein n=1 Tax=Canna indica TaxID=4628 RepID=A0AAQ3QNI2_9LILI|nr:hypothetical protein Cni_G28064 [Canna indica]
MLIISLSAAQAHSTHSRGDKACAPSFLSLPSPSALSIGRSSPPADQILSPFSLLPSTYLSLSLIEVSDERLFFFPGDGKMHNESPTIGAYFVEVKEGVDEMIEFLANEPSEGLFFVQEHAKNSMPYLLDVKDKVSEEIHEVILHTEDIEDSVCSVRSMKEYGIPIADEMIKDINRSLKIMSVSQPKRGLIRNPSWNVRTSNSSRQDSFNYSIGNYQLGGSNGSYLSAVFDSAKQKAAGIRWSLPDTMTRNSNTNQPSSVKPLQANKDATPATPDNGGEELPLSSQVLDDELDNAIASSESLYINNKSSMLQDYDKFKSEKEAKFKEWLEPESPRRHNKPIV